MILTCFTHSVSFGGSMGFTVSRQIDFDGRAGMRIEMNFLRLAVEISGLGVPVLAFAFVHRHFDGVAIGALEGGVFIQDALNPVVTGGDVGEMMQRISFCFAGNGGLLAGCEAVNIRAKKLHGPRFFFDDLHARFRAFNVGRKDYEDAAIERSGAELRSERNCEWRGFLLHRLRRAGYTRRARGCHEYRGASGEQDEARERVSGKFTYGVARFTLRDL